MRSIEGCNAAKANRAACQLTAKGSASDALSIGTASGTVTRFDAGIDTYWANAPGRGSIEMIWRVGHRFSRAALQAGQVPQVTSGLIVTRVPSIGPP